MFSFKCEIFAVQVAYSCVTELFPKWGTQVHVKKTIHFWYFELATVTPQALKHV